MKYAIILPDGAADEPIPELDGRTPLAAAKTPHIDWISSNGRQGLVRTVPEGFLPGSDVATLSVLGYDPAIDHHGRAPLEAAAQELSVGPDDLIFRCNLVTIIDGTMIDFTAGHISQAEADRIVTDLNQDLSDQEYRFHSGVSYRNLMVAPGRGDTAVTCVPPHDIPDQPVKKHMPRGPGARWVCDVMDRAREILSAHEVNPVRRDLGENPATDIWLWGQGRPHKLASFAERFGLRGAVIAGVDLIRGIGKVVGLEVLDVPGATGFLDTDYQAKGAAGVEALDRYDLVVVHVEAPDEAGHLGDLQAKIEAIERVDEMVVGPLLEKLRSFDQWRILIAPDHPTPVGRRVHTADPPPFCFAGSGVSTVLNRSFSEEACRQSDLQIAHGHELMDFFLGR